MFLHHTRSSLAAATVKSVQLLSVHVVSRLVYLENLAAAPKLNGKNGVENTK